MEGGTRFVDPDHVRAGWRLQLPPTTDGGAEGDAPAGQRRGVGPDNGDRLPELVALGMGSLACATLSRRARSRRPDRSLHRRSRVAAGGVGGGDGRGRAAAPLRRSSSIAYVRVRQLPPRELAQWRSHRPSGARHPRLPIGCHVLADRAQGRPSRWVRAAARRAAWHVDHTALGDEDTLAPYVPIALPIGEDDDGSWLVALGPGSVLPLLGESALELERSARDEPRVPGRGRTPCS